MFHVEGMHCAACVHLIEEALCEFPEVRTASANLAARTVTVSGSFGEETAEELARRLEVPLRPHGYSLSVQPVSLPVRWTDFKFAVPIAFLFLAFFVLLQKAGIVNLIGTGDVSYGTVVIIGIVASLSTCMAVVGGLVLSLSATYAKEERSTAAPQVFFHVGRLIGFFVLGGAIGLLGTAFTLSPIASFTLGVLIGIVLLILGVNLLDVVHVTRRFQFTMPRFISSHVREISRANHTLTPFLAGVVTFFLPCGFTQSMQLYTLGTGGFLPGALTMFVYALGTLPVLAFISVTSVKFHESRYAGVFFKTAGLIVIAFALMNIVNSFVVIGAIEPVFRF